MPWLVLAMDFEMSSGYRMETKKVPIPKDAALMAMLFSRLQNKWQIFVCVSHGLTKASLYLPGRWYHLGSTIMEQEGCTECQC